MESLAAVGAVVGIATSWLDPCPRGESLTSPSGPGRYGVASTALLRVAPCGETWRVVSVWSAGHAERMHRTNYRPVSPQVRRISHPSDPTPKAGVGSSNLPRRTVCWCRSAPVYLRPV